MSPCLHHLDDDPTGLRCLLNEHPAHPNGHRYDATAGPDLGNEA